MSENVIKVEELEGGLRATFVNMPHFRTTSARLTINSGSLHENEATSGAAHFLEHVTFQGTEMFPTEQIRDQYSEENGLGSNASTSQTITSYITDGYDLESVASHVVQVPLFPLLNSETLERERKPILDEMRGRSSTPYFLPNIEHARALRGDRYARPVIGTPDDVHNMTHEHLTEYYERNYRLGNAALVICSSEPINLQREYAQRLLAGVQDDGGNQPTRIDLPDFNPQNLDSSLQQVDMPMHAQTSINLNYGLPELKTDDEVSTHNVIATALGRLANRRLRSDLALCYSASAGINALSNVHFGNERHWSHLWVSANLEGSDSIAGLDAMLNDVLLQPLPDSTIEATLQSFRRGIDHLMQSNPSTIADTICNILAATMTEEVDLEQNLHFANRVTTNDIQQAYKAMTEKPPLVLATSPDPKILEAIGDWASQLPALSK